MNRPSFFHGAIAAAVLALIGAIGFTGLSMVSGAALALKIVTIVLSGAYVVYLLRSSTERTGRIATVTAWAGITTGAWFFTADLSVALVTQCVLISLVRSLYHHRSVLAGLLDFGLSAFALSAAVWAYTHSGSLFLSVWCFFLVQALFTRIPRSFSSTPKTPEEDDFGRAYRAAETAIKRIATQR